MIKIISKYFKKKPDKVYSVKAVYHVDTSEIEAALTKVKELEKSIKRARTLAGELARDARLIKVNFETEFGTTEPADITSDGDGNI